MKDRIRKDPGKMHGYTIRDSSNVRYVGWQEGDMYVIFKNDSSSARMYKYVGVSRQRAVACCLAKSVGKYISSKIKPNYKAVKIA